MSDKPANGEQRARKSKDSDVSHMPSTGASKKTGLLLAGAAVVALLLGGGYYAWNNGTTNQVASIDNASSPYAYDEVTGKEATKAGAAAATASDGQTTAPAPQKKSRAAAAEVPEETIGVSRVSARGSQTDDIVVNAKRRAVWRYAPRPERLAEYYPASALDRGREGEARLRCMIGEKGKLDCESVSETPAKAGFGRAALQVARTLRHADRRADGSNAIGKPLNLRVVFRMAEGDRRRG